MCKTFGAHIDDYTAGFLSPETRRMMDQHLMGCLSCREELAFATQLRGVASVASPHPAPRELPFRIFQSLNDVTIEKERRSGFSWAPLGISTAAAMAVVALFLVLAPYRIPQRTASTLSASTDLIPVTLSLELPSATEVAVVGDFNGWNTRATRLVKQHGVWTCTLTLKPGQYQYMFVVNGGQWVTDPKALHQVEDGYGRRNALLTI